MRGQNMTIQNKTKNALERVVNQAVSEGVADAYLCRLQLPKEFASNIKESNDIYKKIISDFGKNVMRKTGATPRYITVKTDNAANPEYALCLFTKHGAGLGANTEDYAEKGREIANGKVGQAGWGNGKLDLMELFKDAPTFKIAHDPTQITQENKVTERHFTTHQNKNPRMNLYGMKLTTQHCSFSWRSHWYIT